MASFPRVWVREGFEGAAGLLERIRAQASAGIVV